MRVVDEKEKEGNKKKKKLGRRDGLNRQSMP